MAVTKLSPKAFAEGHRKLVEAAIAPSAQKLKSKTLNDALENDLYARRDEPSVKVVLDNIKEIGDQASRKLPLKDCEPPLVFRPVEP